MVYTVDGIEYIRKVGSRQEVWDKVVYCTSGKLTRDCLEERNGKIISKRRSQMGKKRFSDGSVFQKKSGTEEEKKEPEKKKEPKRKRKIISEEKQDTSSKPYVARDQPPWRRRRKRRPLQ